MPHFLMIYVGQCIVDYKSTDPKQDINKRTGSVFLTPIRHKLTQFTAGFSKILKHVTSSHCVIVAAKPDQVSKTLCADCQDMMKTLQITFFFRIPT